MSKVVLQHGSVLEAAEKAKVASAVLARLSTEAKNAALLAIAGKLEEHAADIIAANQRDLEMARPAVEAGEMTDAMFRRLKLDDRKLADVVLGVRQVAALEDPVGRITLATEL